MVSMYFLFTGNVEFTTSVKHSGQAYLLEAGNIFGMEDYIYHLPAEKHHALNDKAEFFAELQIKGWRNRRFTVKTTTRCELLSLKLRRNIEAL